MSRHTKKPTKVLVPADADPLTVQQRAFCAAFAVCGTIRHAAEKSGVGRTSHFTWMQESPAYRNAFAEAYEDAGDNAEFEMRRRGFAGSDRLLLEIVRAHKPEKYRQRVDTRIAGHDGGPAIPNTAGDITSVLMATPATRAAALVLAEAVAAEDAAKFAKAGGA